MGRTAELAPELIWLREENAGLLPAVLQAHGERTLESTSFVAAAPEVWAWPDEGAATVAVTPETESADWPADWSMAPPLLYAAASLIAESRDTICTVEVL